MYCHNAADFADADADANFGMPVQCGKRSISDIDSDSTCTGFSSFSRCSSFADPMTPVAVARALPPPIWTAAGPSSYWQPSNLGMGPGDVLYVQSSSRNSLNVGVVGGFLGHVLVLLSEPRLIHFDSEEADEFREVLPTGNIWPVLRARSMEATRGDSGLHQADVFFHLTDGGRVKMIAELNDECEWVPYLDNTTELWTAPIELRAGFRVNLMAEVVKEMTAVEDDWSLSTAIRAVLRQADVSERLDTGVVLQELQDCWLEKPICTSIVIAFWQRYLFKLAELPSAPADPAALILQWMPLKADRTLPNELLSTMARCGWRQFQQEPVSQMRYVRL